MGKSTNRRSVNVPRVLLVVIAVGIVLIPAGCGTSVTTSDNDRTYPDYDATFAGFQQSVDEAAQTRVASSPQATPEENIDVGYRDFSYIATDVVQPTGSKTNHPVWYNDGIWWASLFNPEADSFHIYRLNPETQEWLDTGSLIDSRNTSSADILWDGSNLFVVSAGSSPRSRDDRAQFSRFSYDSTRKTYLPEPDFPVVLTDHGLRSISLAKDASDTLWLSYTHEAVIWVNSSSDGGMTWDGPTELDVAGTRVTPEDVSVIFAYDSRVGIVWSNQVEDAFYFTSLTTSDGIDDWSVTQILLKDVGVADNHLSVATLEDDPAGKVFVAAKTSKDIVDEPDPDSPMIVLFVLGQDDLWRNTVVSRLRDGHTRPSLAIDKDGRRVFVFATAPTYGGAIYVKSTLLDDLRFSAGPGTVVIRTRSDKRINNAAVSQQTITRESGLLVIASDKDSRMYLHNYFPGDQLDSLGR